MSVESVEHVRNLILSFSFKNNYYSLLFFREERGMKICMGGWGGRSVGFHFYFFPLLSGFIFFLVF